MLRQKVLAVSGDQRKSNEPFSGSSEQFLSFKNWLSFVTGEAAYADEVTAASIPGVI
jgi:hypothetical protein